MSKQSLLPTFEPSEADLIQQALDVPFERKVDKAVGFYKYHCNPSTYGAFSGGKDSLALRIIAKMAGSDINWHYNNVTIDPPELVAYIRHHHADVTWNNPSVGLIARMVEKANCPTRRGRWCCAEYKECNGSGLNKLIGVRISESASRAKRWSTLTPDRKSKAYFYAPLAYWTDDDVWRLIKENDTPYCELYDQGFKRLGCVGCPLGGAKHVAVEFARWPRFERAWLMGFERLWAKWHGVPTQRERATVFVKIQGKWYPDRALFRKDFTPEDWNLIITQPLELPLELRGMMVGMTRQRYFEKHLSGQGFFDWWKSGGAFEGEDDQCVFEDMMEQR